MTTIISHSESDFKSVEESWNPKVECAMKTLVFTNPTSSKGQGTWIASV